MKKIIFTRPDGGLSVVTPAQGARLATALLERDGTVFASSEKPIPVGRFLRIWPAEGYTAVWAETEDEFVARIRAKDVPADAIDVQVVDESAIPADRTFRDAWKARAGGVEVDMVKAASLK